MSDLHEPPQRKSGLPPVAKLFLFFAGLLLLWTVALPPVLGWVMRREMTQALDNARQIQMAMNQLAVDSGGLPADTGIKSVTELKERLIKGNYLTTEGAAQINFARFKIGNVSTNDPPRTIVIRNAREEVLTLILLKSGDGSLRHPNRGVDGEAPPRMPAFLPNQ